MMNLKVIYVGKGQFKKRVASHFVGHKITLQRQNLRDIHAITLV
jgi:DNA polymerase-3 subunit epsilon